jgi:hypothetical protein
MLVLEKCSEKKIPYLQFFRIFIFGLTINKIFPQSGNIYRSITLKNRFGIAYTSYISAYSSFAWLDSWQNMIIAIAILALNQSSFQLWGVNAIFLLSALAVIIVCAPFLFYILSTGFKKLYDRPFWIHSKLAEVLYTILSNLRDLNFLFKISLMGILVFTTTCGLFFLCFETIDIHLPPSQLALFYALYKITAITNITPGNFGIRELAYGILSEQLQLTMADGVFVSVIIRILNYIVLFSLFFFMGGFEVAKNIKKDYPPSAQS